MITIFDDIVQSVIELIKSINYEDIFSNEIAVQTKSPANFVTNADLFIEKKIAEGLTNIEKIPCLSEEYNSTVDGGDYWVVDPIDGTTNFIHSYPSYCLSIVKVKNNQTTYGFVYNFVTKELFIGAKDKGSWICSLKENTSLPKKINVSKNDNLSDSLIAFGCPYDKTKTEKLFAISNKILNVCHDLKRNGPASLDICYVACGRLDGYYEFDLKEWDYKAAKLILEEAGGCLSDWTGKKYLIGQNNVVASNSRIHSELLTFLN